MPTSWRDDDSDGESTSSLVVYNKVDIARIQAEMEREFNQPRTSRFLKSLPVGETVLRVLPPTGDMKLPWRSAPIHEMNRVDGSFCTIVCPRIATRGVRSCPVCEEVSRLNASNNEVDGKKAGKIAAKDKAFCNVVVRGEEHLGAKIWKFNARPFRKGGKHKSVGAELLSLFIPDEDTGIGGDFSDPVTGFDIKVGRTGSGQFDTTWTIKAGKKRPLHPDPEERERILASMHDLTRYVTVPTVEEIARTMKGEPNPSVGTSRMQKGMESDDMPF